MYQLLNSNYYGILDRMKFSNHFKKEKKTCPIYENKIDIKEVLMQNSGQFECLMLPNHQTLVMKYKLIAK